jgi:hypothetical protein
MQGVKTKKELSPEQLEELLRALKARFEKNMNRHKGLEWAKVQAKREANPEKLWSLNEMERTGGEPDVVGHDKKMGEYVFYDCSAESPKGRTSVCYDREGLESGKELKPANNAIDMAAAMGIELLTEEQYRELQKLGEFDTKTSSWAKTPADIRKLGGSLFCDGVFMVSAFLSLFEFTTKRCGSASRHSSGRNPHSRRADTFTRFIASHSV